MKRSSKFKGTGAKKRKSVPQSPNEAQASEDSAFGAFQAFAGKPLTAGPAPASNSNATDNICNPSVAGISAESLCVPCCRSSPWFEFWRKIFDAAHEFDLDLDLDLDPGFVGNTDTK